MIRARFLNLHCDPRPVLWPISHPYWVTGWTTHNGVDAAWIVAYADDEEQIKTLWPQAEDIDAIEVVGYAFTDRFPKPDWFTEKLEGVYTDARTRMLLGVDNAVGRRVNNERAQSNSDAACSILNRNPQVTSAILIAIVERAGLCISDDGTLVKFNNTTTNVGRTPELALVKQIIHHVEKMR